MTLNPLPPLSVNAPIERLGLGIRIYNALRRAKIKTVAQLLEQIDAGTINDIYQLGDKASQEIVSRLSEFSITYPAQNSTDHINNSGLSIPPQPSQSESLVIPQQVLEWQIRLIKKQIHSGLMHPKAIYQGASIAKWISPDGNFQPNYLYEVYRRILGASLNISDEVELLFKNIDIRARKILLQRYGSQPHTLDAIGSQLGITRERVRQVTKQSERIIRQAYFRGYSLIRSQSALMHASDMGATLNILALKDHLNNLGLLGFKQEFAPPFEYFLTLVRILSAEKETSFQIPDNLALALELASTGRATVDVGGVQLLNNLPKPQKKLISRHLKFSGAINLKWLADELPVEANKLKAILGAMEFIPIHDSWYVPSDTSKPIQLTAHSVFHNALHKLFYFCGPLPIDSICAGLRHATSRTTFPVAPPVVMKSLLKSYGYVCEDDLYYWPQEVTTELSSSEQLIMDQLKLHNGVVHHVELAQAFVESGLSFPSLHRTLTSSSLFEKISSGIYKLRGSNVSEQQVKRTRAAGERIPSKIEISFDMGGNIVVSLNIGIFPLAAGVIFSEQLPNLVGEWECEANGQKFRSLVATRNELRRVAKPLLFLNCEIGDRVQFAFNTWTRSVIVEKVKT